MFPLRSLGNDLEDSDDSSIKKEGIIEELRTKIRQLLKQQKVYEKLQDQIDEMAKQIDKYNKQKKAYRKEFSLISNLFGVKPEILHISLRDIIQEATLLSQHYFSKCIV